MDDTNLKIFFDGQFLDKRIAHQRFAHCKNA